MCLVRRKEDSKDPVKIVYTMLLTLGLGGSSLATVTLAVVRYIKIRFPFTRIRKIYIYLLAAIFHLYLLVLFSYVLSLNKALWIVSAQTLFLSVETGGKLLYSLVALPFYLNYLLSITASMLSVLTLLRSRDLTEIQQQKLAGSKKIILMNIGVTVLSFLMVAGEVDIQRSSPGPPSHGLMLVVWNLFPRTLAVLNPVVFIVMTWERMKEKWRRRRRRSGVSSKSGSTLRRRGNGELGRQFTMDCQIAEGSREVAEGSREVAEGSREVAEGSREVAEGSCEVAEGSREVAEGSQKVAEGSLEVAEGSREVAEGSREVAEGSREVAEGSQKVAECSREVVEGSREVAESSREVAEGSREVAEGSHEVGKLVTIIFNKISVSNVQIDPPCVSPNVETEQEKV